jgi:hypothetical protein
MMETRVYNEINVILAVSVIICIHSIFLKNQFQCEVDHS